MARTHPEHRESLCTDLVVAMRYDFSGANFMTGWSAVNLFNPPSPVFGRSPEYDFRSVMAYDSGMFSGQQCRYNLDKCALARYIDPEHHERGVERILPWNSPGWADALWVKGIYPWMEPWTPELA